MLKLSRFQDELSRNGIPVEMVELVGADEIRIHFAAGATEQQKASAQLMAVTFKTVAEVDPVPPLTETEILWVREQARKAR